MSTHTSSTPSFTLRQLEHFVALAECSSIREAAARIHISESALTASLDQLEKGLGLQLCVRRKAQGISLTPNGRDMSIQAQQLLRAARELGSAAAHLRGSVCGTVRIGCVTGLAPTTLPRIMAAVHCRHPEVTITFELDSRRDIIAGARAGRFDLAIVTAGDLPEGLTSVTLYHNDIRVVLPGEHPLAEADVVELSDLADIPMVLVDTAESESNVNAIFGSINTQPTVAVRAHTLDLARSFVGWGFGYSLQLQQDIGDFRWEGRSLAIRPVRPAPPRQPVVIAWSSYAEMPVRISAVIDVAVSEFRRDTPVRSLQP